MKIVTIIGNRPQFIKTALVSKEIRKDDTEILLHTGQHYDTNLSDIFFKELNIPTPEINLEIKNTNPSEQTALMMQGIDDVLMSECPDCIIVYGDTNSTLAGAITGSKLHIPIAHIEAGLRSFNKKMPEEINRILTDHVSTLLFCPNDVAIKNLNNEGINEGIIKSGDVMEEVFSVVYSKTTKSNENLYAYMTLHRAENTDDKLMLRNRIEQVAELPIDIIWPIHPRTKKQIKKYKIDIPSKIHIINPQGYAQNLKYIKNAQFILTDSGGLQKESYWAGIPCYTLRTETEWLYTVQNGWNTIIAPKDNLRKKIEAYTIPVDHYLRDENISESKLIVETIRELIMNFCG